MVIRVFKARLKPGKRAEFEWLTRRSSLPVIRAHPGCLSARIWDAPADRPDIFVLTSIWQDLPSLQGFAGETWREAIVLPGEADLLEEATVEHYDESYRSLTTMWHAMAAEVRRREVIAMTRPLTDAQWARLQPLLPPTRKQGRPRADDRRTLDGILYVLRTGCRWRDLPPDYGSPVTCWRRFVQWEAGGVWERVWRAYFSSLDAQGKRAWAQAFVDSRYVPIRPGRDHTAARAFAAPVVPAPSPASPAPVARQA